MKTTELSDLPELLELCENEADFAEYDRLEDEVLLRGVGEQAGNHGEEAEAVGGSLSLVATNQESAAYTLGIDARTLQRWIKRGCPGRPRNYVLRDIIAWARENAWSEEAVLIEGATGEESDIKTQYLRARVEKLNRENVLADFKIDQQSEYLVPVDEVSALLTEQANIFRGGLEKLERNHGRDALDLVLELIEELEAVDFIRTT